jgi:negative regulator of flagellin synthesis FlgM
MSRIDSAKLAPTTPITAVGNGARAGAASEQSQTRETGRGGGAGPAQGVSVEVAIRIEAGQPPVNTDRVAEIRSALQDGSYPIVPVEIADALIAARLMMGYGE